jgi:hypothetical protein
MVTLRESGTGAMTAKIYKPAKTAMQSGKAKTKRWLLEFEQEKPRSVEPLMGWTSSSETKQQVKLWFDTREAAIAYAERNGIAYTVTVAPDSKVPTLSYSDNFKTSRIGQWTH